MHLFEQVDNCMINAVAATTAAAAAAGQKKPGGNDGKARGRLE